MDVHDLIVVIQEEIAACIWDLNFETIYHHLRIKVSKMEDPEPRSAEMNFLFSTVIVLFWLLEVH